MKTGLLHDGLEYWARRHPEKPVAVLDQHTSVTYGDLHRWSDGLAARLQQVGVQARDNVAIAGANSLAWVASAFAVLKAGGVIAPFNDRLLGDELAYLAGYTEPRLIIADAPRAARLREAGVNIPIIPLEDVDADRSGPPPDWRAIRVDSSEAALIIFTSGSTARPKGAMLSHASYLAKFLEMRTFDSALGVETRSLMPFGLHSSPGLPWGILFSALLGGTLYFGSKYQAEKTLQTLLEEKINFFIGTPMIYAQVSELAAFQTADFAALRFARVGGASISEQLLGRWREKGVVVRQLYGMTETGGGSIIASPEEALARPASCGRGLPFTRFRIVRPDGGDCAAGEPGDILLQGPGLMSGYWRDPAATAAALIDGWMHTGDIGVVDEEGYFSFVDRAKEMIKSGGFNVSPTEVEAVLLEIAGLAEAAVFAVPDETFGETPFACVYAKTPIAPQAVYDHCSKRLAGFKLPRYVVAMNEPLPRLANEKIDRRRLKSDYADPSRRPAKLGPAPR